MGFTPQQVNEMSVWQFMAAFDGMAEANDPEGDKSLTSTELDDLWGMVKGHA